MNLILVHNLLYFLLDEDLLNIDGIIYSYENQKVCEYVQTWFSLIWNLNNNCELLIYPQSKSDKKIISSDIEYNDFARKLRELGKPNYILSPNKLDETLDSIANTNFTIIEERKWTTQQIFSFYEDQSNWGLLSPLRLIPQIFPMCPYFHHYVDNKNIKIPANQIFPSDAMKRKIISIQHEILSYQLLGEPTINIKYDDMQNVDINLQIRYNWAQFSRSSIQLNIHFTIQYEYSKPTMFQIELKKYQEFQKMITNLETRIKGGKFPFLGKDT